MNVLNVYEAVLIELNKVEAPSLLLEDFIYFLNKAIQQYQNKMYNMVDSGQQKMDDLLVFYKDVKLEVIKKSNIIEIPVTDYVHSLGCDIEFTDSCGRKYTKGCTKYTSNINSAVKDNYYFKPSFKRPYYSIQSSGVNSVIVKIDHGDSEKYTLEFILFKYLRTPTIFTSDDLDLDNMGVNSTELEYSNYVCYEIINDITKLILENASDPRLQSNIPVNQSIAVPGK